ncbi:dTMP kinase [Aureimonas fodinaquatilis]|uniref:Thymidylate kinase n=1 Tax=Aureimonas fodinaquatilis TaxID=2565783 RepID=A0A5B0DX79_9HYPH|nr:dTMP kinase [Aureimonas fodinaquatilis]KAA0970371.1 dTMP kinase [Aureimonas fodinaquatilis]
MAGLFITFEGGEGSGKTTQVERLAAALEARGRDVHVTREPGGTTGADILRELVLSGAARQFGNDIEAVLFAAARADHVAAVIAPNLAGNVDVICDRFIDSTRVYQGRDDNGPFLAALEKAVLQGHQPDLTFILDLPADVGLARANARRGNVNADRFESEETEIHEARRQRFLAIARKEPQRCHVIDAQRPIAEVAAEILVKVDMFFLQSTGE